MNRGENSDPFQEGTSEKNQEISGFIVTSQFKNEGDRIYLELAGLLEDGRSFLWLQSNLYLFAFIEEGIKGERAAKQIPGKFKSLRGKPMEMVRYRFLPDIHNDKAAHGQSLLEADVEHSHRFLMEKGIKGGVRFLSPPSDQRERTAIFYNPRVKPDRFTQSLRVLAFDIETGVRSQDITDAAKNDLYSIAFYSEGKKKVIMVAGEDRQEDYIHYVPDEAAAIEAFIEDVHEINPQIFAGWNVLNFDFQFLINKAKHYGIPLNLGVARTPLIHFTGKSGTDIHVRMPGRVVQEGISALKLLHIHTPNYRLETVGHSLLGQGKTMTLEGEDKINAIKTYYRQDKVKLAEYNLWDAKLVYDICQKLHIVDFQKIRIETSGVPFDKLGSSTDIFDATYLPALHREGFVAPYSAPQFSAVSRSGRFYHRSKGYFENVFSLKFPFLQAQAIEAFCIDPLGRYYAQQEGEEANSIKTSSGLPFHRKKHILPGEIRALIDPHRRTEKTDKSVRLKALGNILDHLISAMRSKDCRFYSPALVNAMEAACGQILDQTKLALEGMGYRIVFEEQDTLYVTKDKAVDEAQIDLTIKALKKELQRRFLETHGDLSEFIIHFDQYFIYFFGTHIGSEKSVTPVYMGMNKKGENETSIARSNARLVRGDIVKLADRFEEELLLTLFRKQNPLDCIRHFQEKLNQGHFDDLLVYKKRLVKNLSDYEEPSPPHIQAAKKMSVPPSKWISYVMTTDGPEPLDLRSAAALDYSHYTRKFLQSIGQAVLEPTAYKEAAFDLFSNDHQLSLFHF